MDTTDNQAEALAKWAKAEQERQQEQFEDDLQRLMATESGRRFVWWLLESAGIYHSSFRKDALEMTFAEGKRANGMVLLDFVSTVTPTEYLIMQQEAFNGRQQRQHRRDLAIRDAGK